jgi:hypothetical protein
MDDYPEEESKLKKLLKRTYVVGIALFLVFLFLVNTLPGYHIVSLVSGRLVSSTLQEDYSFSLKNGGIVIFQLAVFENLRELYLDNQQHEIKVCLTGDKNNSTYHVTGMYIPKIYHQDFRSVSSEFCNSETIVTLHSHPFLSCIFSDQDIKSFNNYRKSNPDALLGLMCEQERFTFYGY